MEDPSKRLCVCPECDCLHLSAEGGLSRVTVCRKCAPKEAPARRVVEAAAQGMEWVTAPMFKSKVDMVVPGAFQIRTIKEGTLYAPLAAADNKVFAREGAQEPYGTGDVFGIGFLREHPNWFEEVK